MDVIENAVSVFVYEIFTEAVVVIVILAVVIGGVFSANARDHQLAKDLAGKLRVEKIIDFCNSCVIREHLGNLIQRQLGVSQHERLGAELLALGHALGQAGSDHQLIDQRVQLLKRAYAALVDKGQKSVHNVLYLKLAVELLRKVIVGFCPVDQRGICRGEFLATDRNDRHVKDLTHILLSVLLEPCQGRVDRIHERIKRECIGGVAVVTHNRLGHSREYVVPILLGGQLNAVMDSEIGFKAHFQSQIGVNGFHGIEHLGKLCHAVLGACKLQECVHTGSVKLGVFVEHQTELCKTFLSVRIDRIKCLLQIGQKRLHRQNRKRIQIHFVILIGLGDHHAVAVNEGQLVDRSVIGVRDFDLHECQIGVALLVHGQVELVLRALHISNEGNRSVTEIENLGEQQLEKLLVALDLPFLDVARCGKTNLVNVTAPQAIAAAQTRLDLGGLYVHDPLVPVMSLCGNRNLVTNGTDRSFLTGCHVLNSVSRRRVVFQLALFVTILILAQVIGITAVGAIHIGDMLHAVPVVSERRLQIIYCHVVTVFALFGGVAGGIAGYLNRVKHDRMLVLAATATHFGRFAVSDRVAGEVRSLKAYGSHSVAVLVTEHHVFDLFGFTRFVVDEPDHNAVGILAFTRGFIGHLQRVRQRYGDGRVEVANSRVATRYQHAEIVDLGIFQRLQIICIQRIFSCVVQRFLRLLNQSILGGIFHHVSLNGDLSISCGFLHLLDHFRGELNIRSFQLDLKGLVGINIGSSNIGFLYVASVKVRNFVRATRTMLMRPAVVGGFIRNVVMSKTCDRFGFGCVTEATSIFLEADSRTVGIFPVGRIVVIKAMYVGRCRQNDLCGMRITALVLTGHVLVTVIHTGRLNDYGMLLVPVVIQLQFGGAVLLVLQLTFATGQDRVRALQTGCGIIRACIHGRVRLTLVARTVGAGYGMRTVVLIVILRIMRYLFQRFGSDFTATFTGEGHYTRRDTGGGLGHVTLIPQGMRQLFGFRTRADSYAAGSTNTVTGITLLSAGCSANVFQLGLRVRTRCGRRGRIIVIAAFISSAWRGRGGCVVVFGFVRMRFGPRIGAGHGIIRTHTRGQNHAQNQQDRQHG